MTRKAKRNPDLLKPLEEVFEPDPRQTVYSFIDRASGEIRPRVLTDHYAAIANVALSEAVPDQIRVHFETARNLLLYSWFAYRFTHVAELHAFSTVEMALRSKLGYPDSPESPTLKRLLSEGVSRGLIRGEGFAHYRMIQERRAELTESTEEELEDEPAGLAYTRRLVENMPYFRNVFAHGSPTLMSHGYLWVGICCDLLNQLYEAENP